MDSRTASDPAVSEALARARRLRARRLRARGGFSLVGGLVLIALISPGIAVQLIYIAAIVALFSSIEAWLARRHNDAVRRRREAVRGPR